MKISRRKVCSALCVTGGVLMTSHAMAFSLNSVLSGGGGDDVGSIKKLLAAAAKADARMNAYFLFALGKKEEADKFSAAALAMSEDTVDEDYDKLNDLKDDHPVKADDLGNFKPSKETNEALAAGQAMGSVALMNYMFVLPKLAGIISAIKSNPMMLLANLSLLPTLANAITAIPGGITTITSMIKTSNDIAKKNDIPIKSKEEIAELSESVGGTADTSALPE